VAELLSERWTLVVAALWVVTVSSIAWWLQRLPAWLTLPGIALAWGIGLLHNVGILPDGGYG
jgi:hypothetical protein